MCGREIIDIDFASLLGKKIHFVPLTFWLRLGIYSFFFIDFRCGVNQLNYKDFDLSLKNQLNYKVFDLSLKIVLKEISQKI